MGRLWNWLFGGSGSGCVCSDEGNPGHQFCNPPEFDDTDHAVEMTYFGGGR